MAQLPRRKIVSPLQRGWADIRSMQETQRLYIRHELAQARGLLPILMKRRKGRENRANQPPTSGSAMRPDIRD